jgi:hypothetical protein
MLNQALLDACASVSVPVPAQSGLANFLADLVLANCPDAIESVRTKLLTLGSAKPSKVDVAAYAGIKISDGIFDEPMGIHLVDSLKPSFLALAHELNYGASNGRIEQWLRVYTGRGAYSVEFVSAVAAFLHECLDRKAKAAA